MKTIKMIFSIIAIGMMTNVHAQEQKFQKNRKAHLLKDADKNAEGKISVAEFETAKTKMEAQRLERCKERFTELDANKDGAITFEEFKAKESRMEKQRLDFKSVDADNDGFLSQEELKAFRMKHRAEKGKPSVLGKRRGHLGKCTQSTECRRAKK